MGAMIRIATVCLLLYWVVIFVATHLPAQTLPKLHWSDKAYHAIAFAGLGFLLAWAIPSHRDKWVKHIAITFCLAAIYVAADELTQTFIPSRSCDLQDFAVDLLGIAAGLIAYLGLRAGLLRVRWGRRLIVCLSR